MNSGIYIITNTESGKVYVGSTIDFQKRWGAHRSTIRRGAHDNSHLQHAWNKYGEAAFEFIICEYVEDKEQLHIREQYWLDYHRMLTEVYNCGIVARSPTLGGHLTEETKTKISVAKKGRQHTEETRRRMSAAHKGKTLSEEAKQKLYTATKGVTKSEEHRHKLSMALLGRENEHTAKDYPSFINQKTGEIIVSGRNLSKMCRELNLTMGCMSKVKNGKKHSHKGWILFS